MTTSFTHTPDKTAKQTMNFLQAMLKDYHPRDFSIRLWDGSEWPAETVRPRFTLILKHEGMLRRMLRRTDTDLSLGEAYIYDDFDIEGDIQAIFPVARYLAGLDWGLTKKVQWGWKLLRLPNAQSQKNGGRGGAQISGSPHSIERDRQAVTYHYDVSNDFYALWLDRRMVYSCAYFASPDEGLEAAQQRKLDYICRKLRLQPGERLLDIGCGWGGLVIYAVKHFGVEALGITLSQPQADLANQRIRSAGLADRCRVEVADYREMDEEDGFDKLVSVGMFEHVGEALLSVYFQRAWQLLRPGGVFLNHGIARCATDPPPKGPTFSDRYVFPDGELVPIHVTLRHAEEAGFEVRDVESLREHYALTLQQWVQRLQARHEEALQIVGETTYRIWRLYMSGSAYGFWQGSLNVYQTLLAKPDHGDSGLPLTRDDWYCMSE
ncbi:MAG: class I SAM-dependent methyltransferase [Chloroflexi bacterium]|nr:class I SAM-dependent methyltransferase [Chloroflexota bacterium]